MNKRSLNNNDTNFRYFLPGDLLLTQVNKNFKSPEISENLKNIFNKEEEDKKENKNLNAIRPKEKYPPENPPKSIFEGLKINSIPKIEESFLDENELQEDIAKLKETKKILRRRTFHIKTKNFESYYKILNYFFQENSKKYQYYFCYNDISENFYFQINYNEPKDVTLSKLDNYEFIDPVSDYKKLNQMMEDRQIFDIKIDKKIIFISLKKGPKCIEYFETNKKIIEYAFNNNIELYVEF